MLSNDKILTMDAKQFTMYVDESGDDLIYELPMWEADPILETHCTLMGVVIAHNNKDPLRDELNQIKEDIFRTKEIVLHSVDIRNKRGAFVCFHYSPELYGDFKSRMNVLTNNIRPVLICSSLDKKRWVEKFPRKLFFNDDPYEQAFEYLIERYAHFLNSQESDKIVGNIVIENRGNSLKNKKLKNVLESLRNCGNNYYKVDFFNSLGSKIEFQAKKLNIPGLQLSDYFVYPFYMNHKMPSYENQHYEFLEQFIYPGEYARFGYKKWPI